jgi:beta-phosphoglucomutase-like phosphatase (HAD superfamily)
LSNREFVFGVDLDGVVADFIGGLKPIAAEWLGVPVASLTDDVSYGLKEWGLGGSKGYIELHRFAVKERQLFERLLPIEGAPSALRRLSRKGVRIRVITHRLYIEWFHRQAVIQTVEWLERHGVPYWDLCFMARKSSVEADAYVEDSPANIESLRKAGRHVIVLRNSTNKHVAGPAAVNWEEVEAWIYRKLERSMGVRSRAKGKAPEAAAVGNARAKRHAPRS